MEHILPEMVENSKPSTGYQDVLDSLDVKIHYPIAFCSPVKKLFTVFLVSFIRLQTGYKSSE